MANNVNTHAQPYYGPVGETSIQVLLEKTFLVSGYLTGVGFGVQLVIYGACMKSLIIRNVKTRFTYFLMVYTTILCFMNGIWAAMSAYGLQLAYIDNRNYPNGGPLAFIQVQPSDPSQTVGGVAFILANIMADAMLVWRCREIWAASLARKVDVLMAVPYSMLLCSVAMSILFTLKSVSPEGFFSKVTTSFALLYFGISLSLNILLTLMIVIRLTISRRRVQRHFGEAHGQHLASISAVFVESAALYAICSILLLVTYAIQHPINQIWLGISPAVQEISNYLIIYRVAQGSAWNSNVPEARPSFSNVVFGSRAHQNSRLSCFKTTSTGSTTMIDVSFPGIVAEKSEIGKSHVAMEDPEPPSIWAVMDV